MIASSRRRRRRRSSSWFAAGATAFALVLACVSCGSSSANPDAEPEPGPDATLPQLAELIDDYEQGVISRDELRAAIADLDDGGPSALTTDIVSTTLLEARAEPYRIDANLAVAAGAILVIEEGAELILAADVSLTVHGRFYAIGSDASTIAIHADDETAHFGSIELAGGPNQLVGLEVDRGADAVLVSHAADTHTLIEASRFDSWSKHAILLSASSGLVVRDSRFGTETAEADIAGESIGTLEAGEIVIEGSRFGPRRHYRDVIDLQRCLAGYVSLIGHNYFEGGEDDAIDLDYGCTALVIGNYIHNFRPPAGPASGGVNGGGITGADSAPFIANNVIDGCYHGIGFKDGARPFIINNTIMNSNIGVTLYQAEVGAAAPAGVMINNILVNNVDWDDGTPQDIVLNGKWWPLYNQVDDVQATIDARANILASSAEIYPGEGNTTGDPLLELVDGIPVPAAGSSAIDSGLAAFLLRDGVPSARALELLETDYLGQPRARDGDEFPAIDRGAIERP